MEEFDLGDTIINTISVGKIIDIRNFDGKSRVCLTIMDVEFFDSKINKGFGFKKAKIILVEIYKNKNSTIKPVFSNFYKKKI